MRTRARSRFPVGACKQNFGATEQAKPAILEYSIARETNDRLAPHLPKERSLIAEIANYLRKTAETCVFLARACPDMPTARGLEEMAIDLMAKAKEIEETYAG